MINNFIQKIQPYIIYSLIFSIFLIEKIKYKSLSIYEVIFLILLIISINKIFKFNFKDLLKIENLALIFFIILILCKYFFYNDYLYSVLVMTFLLTTYFLFLFLITNDGQKKITYYNLKNGFKLIYIFSAMMVLIFYALKTFGFLFEDFWYVREDIFPYLNYVTTHFKGFYSSYNYQAYIMIPGYFYILETTFLKNKKIYLILFLIVSFIVFFIIKAKVLFLLIILTFFYLLNNYIQFNKFLFYSFLLIGFLAYVSLSHFIPTKIEMIGDEYKHYFTDSPILILDNFFIYGSLFYKIKLLIFQNIEFFNLVPPNRDFYLEHNIEPHSIYFLLIYNYGISTLFCFLLFSINIFKKFNFLFFEKKYKTLLVDFSIFSLFLIEGFNQDINSYRFFWISTSMFVGLIYININNMKFKH